MKNIWRWTKSDVSNFSNFQLLSHFKELNRLVKKYKREVENLKSSDVSTETWNKITKMERDIRYVEKLLNIYEQKLNWIKEEMKRRRIHKVI